MIAAVPVELEFAPLAITTEPLQFQMHGRSGAVRAMPGDRDV